MNRGARVLPFLLAAACAAPRGPAGHPASVMVRDLQRLVDVRAARGWQIDRLEQDALLPDALESVCRTPPDARTEALAWLDAEVVRLGGPVDVAYRARGRSMAEIEELLEWTRVRDLAVRTLHVAPADCPFWAEPTPGFRGRQIADDRFQLHIEGGGKGILLHTSDGKEDVAGGGAGRLLLGRTIGARWEVVGGVELGGSAWLPKDAMGNRAGPAFALDTVIPVGARWRRTNSYIEATTGLLLRTREQDQKSTPGWHAGISIGARSVRSQWLIPGLAFGFSVEHTLPSDDEDALTLVKLGLRVTFDVDL